VRAGGAAPEGGHRGQRPGRAVGGGGAAGPGARRPSGRAPAVHPPFAAAHTRPAGCKTCTAGLHSLRAARPRTPAQLVQGGRANFLVSESGAALAHQCALVKPSQLVHGGRVLWSLSAARRTRTSATPSGNSARARWDRAGV